MMQPNQKVISQYPTTPFQHKGRARLIAAYTLTGLLMASAGSNVLPAERFSNHDRWDANTEDQNHAELLTPQRGCSTSRELAAGGRCGWLATTGGAHFELQPVAAWELYHGTGEVKGGAGLRGRYWFSDIGVEAQGLSLTPRDSIVDRMDASVCWRYEFSRQFWSDQDSSLASGELNKPALTGILSAGYGSNWEDHAHGPGIGMEVQYHWGNWFGEVGTRSIWEDYSKSLLTFGIGRRF